MAEIIPRPENVARLIYFLRGEKVMLDSELAELYGVTTKALNQAVKRNQSRFPVDFMFRLTAGEWGHLRSRSATSGPGVPSQALGNSSRSVRSSDSNRSQIVTGSQKHRDPRSLPYAFTEQGVAMLSSALHSPRAAAVNIAIMRTFVQLRRLMDSNRDLARKIEAMEKNYDEKFAVVFDAIKRLVADDQARKAQPKVRIGFTR